MGALALLAIDHVSFPVHQRHPIVIYIYIVINTLRIFIVFSRCYQYITIMLIPLFISLLYTTCHGQDMHGNSMPEDPTCFPAPPWSQDCPKTSRQRPCRRNPHHWTRRRSRSFKGGFTGSVKKKNMGKNRTISLVNHRYFS